MNTQNVIVYFYVIFFYIFFTFNADHKNNVNRLLISLPINRKQVVAGRYLFSFISFLLLLSFHYIVDKLAHYGLRYLEFEPLTGLKVVLIITFFSIGVSLSIPIYYFFKSFQIAVYVHIMFFFFGMIGIGIIIGNPYIDFVGMTKSIMNLIAIQPYVILLLFSAVCLYGSYRLSVWLFSRKDI